MDVQNNTKLSHKHIGTTMHRAHLVDTKFHRRHCRIKGVSQLVLTMEFLAVMLTLLTVVSAQTEVHTVTNDSSTLQPGLPNVCPYQDVTMILVRQPCVQAFTRLVKVWKPNCGYTRNWCVGYERRTHYYTTYKDRYQPQQVTRYKCCNGWQLSDQGHSCNNKLPFPSPSPETSGGGNTDTGTSHLRRGLAILGTLARLGT